MRNILKLAVGSAVVLVEFLLCAQPIPKLLSVSPEWIQRGTTTDVVFSGENLSKISQFVFSGDEEHFNVVVGAPSKPGVRLESTSPNVFSSGATSDDKRITAKLTVSQDAPLGSVEMRVIAPGGVSNPINIRLSHTPEINEMGDNHSVDSAPKITMPVGISGRTRVAGQVDYFRFDASKGEQLVFDVQASRLGSALDSSLAILDRKGNELARNEDANGMDSLLTFTVPADGKYVLMLRDFQHRGGDNFTYHLTAGRLPYVESIFPFGGQRGQSVEVKLAGINLDGADVMKMTIDPNSPSGPQEIRAYAPRGISNPLQFDISAFPDTTEVEPNNSITNANEAKVPGNVNGRISQAGEVDVFKFKAEKGQRFIFEIYARRFNSKLDPLLTLMDAKGEIIQRNDDAMGADARIDEKFKQAGEYYISVRDLLDRGGDNFGYRLSIDPPAPADFSAKLLTDTLRLHREGRTIARVEVARNGIGGPIEIVAENLPKGITALPLIIPADFPSGLIEFEASSDAELGSVPLELKAIAVAGGKREMRSVQSVTGSKPATRGRRGKLVVNEGKLVAAAYLTVLEPAPFTIDWLTLSAGIEQNDSTKVQAELKRATGYNGEIKVTVEGFSAANEPITRSLEAGSDTVKGDGTRAEISLKAKLDSETGTRPIYARAEGSSGAQAFVNYSHPMMFRIGEFPFTLTSSLPRLSVTTPPPGSTNNAASEAEFSVRTERRGLLTDDIVLSLEGVPEGLVINSTNIVRGTGEAGFKLLATDKTKVGTNNIAIIGTVDVNGRQYRLRGPNLQLIVNPPAEANETTAAK